MPPRSGPRPASPAASSLAAAVAVVTGVTAGLAGAGAQGAYATAKLLPNPRANRPAPAHVYGPGTPCAPAGGDNWPACNALFLAAINSAQKAEGLRGFTLPSNFLHLGATQQLLVWVNLERISRGIPPLVGYSPYLNAVAAQALRKNWGRLAGRYGPVAVAVNPVTHYYAESAFEGGGSSMAMAGGFVYGLMYQDGWGGEPPGPFSSTSNPACTSAHAPGCWVDRDGLLGQATGISCTDCIAGAASSSADFGSYALLIVRPAQPPGPLSFTWDADVVPYLPPGYERAPAPKQA